MFNYLYRKNVQTRRGVSLQLDDGMLFLSKQFGLSI